MMCDAFSLLPSFLPSRLNSQRISHWLVLPTFEEHRVTLPKKFQVSKLCSESMSVLGKIFSAKLKGFSPNLLVNLSQTLNSIDSMSSTVIIEVPNWPNRSRRGVIPFRESSSSKTLRCFAELNPQRMAVGKTLDSGFDILESESVIS